MPGLAACLLTTGATLLRSWILLSASKHCGLAALESGSSTGPWWKGFLREMRPNAWVHPVIEACGPSVQLQTVLESNPVPAIVGHEVENEPVLLGLRASRVRGFLHRLCSLRGHS